MQNTVMHISELPPVCLEYQLYEISSPTVDAGTAMRPRLVQGCVGGEGGLGQCICAEVVMDRSGWKRIPDHRAVRTI